MLQFLLLSFWNQFQYYQQLFQLNQPILLQTILLLSKFLLHLSDIELQLLDNFFATNSQHQLYSLKSHLKFQNLITYVIQFHPKYQLLQPNFFHKFDNKYLTNHSNSSQHFLIEIECKLILNLSKHLSHLNEPGALLQLIQNQEQKFLLILLDRSTKFLMLFAIILQYSHHLIFGIHKVYSHILVLHRLLHLRHQYKHNPNYHQHLFAV